jgi:hypothetical protein
MTTIIEAYCPSCAYRAQASSQAIAHKMATEHNLQCKKQRS